jgi:hypothetical protein
MKKNITILFLSAAVAVNAQTKVLTQAVITTKTTITSPEGEEDNILQPPAGANGEVVRMIRLGGDGETKSVTTLKGDLVKTLTETEGSRTTVLRDNSKKITTTLMEMMGTKNGFYATDEEQEQMRKHMDSMIQNRRPDNDNAGLRNNAPKVTEIVYVEENKKVAGYECKKALAIITRQNGSKDSNVVWYCPDFKLQGLVSTGGMAGFGGMGRTTSLNGLNDLAGFPMQFEMKLSRGRKMTVEVTKLVTDKEIPNNTFDIPKDFVIKPMKDMQSADGRGFQIRIGGPGN